MILLPIGMFMVLAATVIALALLENEKNWIKMVISVFVFVGLFLFALGVMTETFKDALNYNPYKKEYLYKAAPDGTMTVYDSIYVKKSTEPCLR
jgi:uncharacterized membrane protein